MRSSLENTLEEFLVPVENNATKTVDNVEATSSSNAAKQEFTSQLEENQRPPESPDMKFARSRLGHLLNGIRTGEIQATLQQPKRKSSSGDFEDLTGQQKRPKKLLRRERVVFELRGKPFSLRDSGRSEAVYSLCRTWMRGKEEEHPKAEPNNEEIVEPPEDSLDLLATKEIVALPKPQDDVSADPAPPPLLKKPSATTTFNTAEELLQDSLSHWREIKRNWCDYAKIRDKRFGRSIQLLETVYGIAQQNTL
uniref:Protein phosphatase 1 regulatory subunit 35 n=1 Tax=Syphacia muris TaxID=451379 RepID=A0A158R4Y3_9BILA